MVRAADHPAARVRANPSGSPDSGAGTALAQGARHGPVAATRRLSMSTHRAPFLLALSLSLFLGCAERPPAHGCSSDGQCPVGSRCTKGVCAGGTRPSASLAPLGNVEEFALVQLDGSRSADPEGDLVEHRWSIRSVDAPCPPPEVASREPVAQVRFGCAGRYEVSLTVADSLGLPSDPARMEVTVRASTASPIVVAGADIATDHRCAGRPIVCRPTTAIQLAATAASGVTLRWTVQPPAERALDASRRVTFSPSPSVATPTVDIVTDGTAISGDWIFRAEAVDAYGVVGAAHTRVSVRNRPPVVTFTGLGPFEHTFDAQESVFRSSGAVAWSVVDPDGDPIVEVSGVWRHLGDGDASLFDGDFDGSTVTFTVAVPYLVREDAAKLRGGDGLLRQIELYALDANRTVGSVDIPIVVGNRPPVPADGTVDTSVPHRFDAARSLYVAYVRAGSFVDPDGDPIVDSTGPGLCGTLLARGNDVTAECAFPFVDRPATNELVGIRTFPVAARDPWDAATAVPIRTVEIRNSAPVVAPAPPSVAEINADLFLMMDSCRADAYVNGVEFDVSVAVSDPDGDPVLATPTTSPGGSISATALLLTAGATANLHFVQAPFLWHCFKGNEPPISMVWASDGTPPVGVGVGPTPKLAFRGF